MRLFIPAFLCAVGIQLTACGATTDPSGIPLNKIESAWQVPNQTQGVGQSIVADQIYVGINGSGGATAYDLSTRKAVWNSPVALNALGDENVQTNGKFFALEANGKGVHLVDQAGKVLSFLTAPKELEKYQTGLFAHASFQGSNLFVPFGNILIKYDLTDPQNPKELWRKVMDQDISSMVLDAEQIYLGRFQFERFADNKTITVLKNSDGSVAWKASTDRPDVYLDRSQVLPSMSTTWKMTVFENQLIVMTLGGDLQAFNKASGKRLWTTDNLTKLTKGCYATGDFILKDGTIYANSESDSCLFALNAKDGSLKWTFDAASFNGKNATFGGRPVVYHGVVYAANTWLWALDAETGKALAISSEQDEAANRQAVQVVNGEIIIRGYNLTAFKAIR